MLNIRIHYISDHNIATFILFSVTRHIFLIAHSLTTPPHSPDAGICVSWVDTKRARSREAKKTLRQMKLSSRPWMLRTRVSRRTGWGSHTDELNLSTQIHVENVRPDCGGNSRSPGTTKHVQVQLHQSSNTDLAQPNMSKFNSTSQVTQTWHNQTCPSSTPPVK